MNRGAHWLAEATRNLFVSRMILAHVQKIFDCIWAVDFFRCYYVPHSFYIIFRRTRIRQKF